MDENTAATTTVQDIGLFEIVGMPTYTLVVRTHCEYLNDLHAVQSFRAARHPPV